MNVLIACEESQTVCKAFRAKGHNAFSCDIQECSGGHPEWHIISDVLKVLNGDCLFKTENGEEHIITGKWDLIIAHPPCTYLSNAGTRQYSYKCNPAEKVERRKMLREQAADFFMQFVNAECDHIAIENPVGYMTRKYRKPDQYINPWLWAASVEDEENYHAKKTGLWLKGLPKLEGNGVIQKCNCGEVYGHFSNGKNKNWTETRQRAKVRSKTFPGIANAMAEQWGNI